MKKEEKEIENSIDKGMEDFTLDAKREIVEIMNDCPSLKVVGEKEYEVKNMRYYSLNRICRLVLEMRKNDETLDDDKKVITALCTDLDAMCEIVAVILCNHWFKPDDIRSFEDAQEVMSRNDKMVEVMKAKVMNSTFIPNQWAAIVIGAIQSIDLSAFFLLKKSVSMLTDSILTRKKKSEEIALQFMAAQSLQTQVTS